MVQYAAFVDGDLGLGWRNQMPTERLICPRARIGQAKARRILREKVTPENPIWYVQLIGGGNV
jgi:hypothetical protein